MTHARTRPKVTKTTTKQTDPSSRRGKLSTLAHPLFPSCIKSSGIHLLPGDRSAAFFPHYCFSICLLYVPHVCLRTFFQFSILEHAPQSQGSRGEGKSVFRADSSPLLNARGVRLMAETVQLFSASLRRATPHFASIYIKLRPLHGG